MKKSWNLIINQESKTTNSKFLTTGASIHNNNLMLMDIKKNNTIIQIKQRYFLMNKIKLKKLIKKVNQI